MLLQTGFEYLEVHLFLLDPQGRRKRGTEGANAPSIFTQIYRLIQIFGETKIPIQN